MLTMLFKLPVVLAFVFVEVTKIVGRFLRR